MHDQDKQITPVILSGGAGTRLWPLSRKSYPKQFSDFFGEETLFQQSLQRLRDGPFDAPLVISSDDYRFIVVQQLAGLGIPDVRTLIEPAARGTAPAVLAAALYLEKENPEAMLLIAPSDHVIPDDQAFQQTVLRARSAAQAGQIVTFGITPDRPETGYGYLELSSAPDAGNRQHSLKSFIEKPDAERAEALLADGRFLWNAGILLARADTIIRSFRRIRPDILKAVEATVNGAYADLEFIRLPSGSWESLEDISIDYAILEHADNLSVVPYTGRWSDLGDWASVWRETNEDTCAAHGNTTMIGCENTLMRSEAKGQEIVGIGLTDIIAVAMPDAVLVAHKDRAQDVKQAVTELKAKSAPQAEAFPKDHRPWGWFESLVLGERFQVKRIVVNPGAALSLQSHHHRAEHWIVVEGTAKVTLEGDVKLISENQSVYVPLGAKHRLENPGKLPMVLIEVQTGAYLGEDDIVRYEDRYALDR